MTLMDYDWLPWSDDVADRLGGELGEAFEAKMIRLEVETGRAQILSSDNVIAIFRIEQHLDKTREFVIVALNGKNVVEFSEHVKTFCSERGIQRVRFHSRHPAKLQDRFIPVHLPGFERKESIYIREV